MTSAFASRVANLLADPAPQLPNASTPLTASPAVREAVEAALDRGETHYTDRPGILPLREAIAALVNARFAIPVSAAADVIVTCGLTEARFVAIQQLLYPGDTLAAPVSAERVAGAVLLRRAHLLATVTPTSSVVYLTSSTPEPDLKAHLAALSPTASVLFEIDDPTSNFHPAQIPELQPRTLTVAALEHPSWRIGYLLAPASASPAMREFKQALTICSTSLSQWAVLATLTETQP